MGFLSKSRNLHGLAKRPLLRGFSFFAATAFFPVHVSAVETAEIAQGGHRRAGFQQEMVAGNLGIAWDAQVAILHPA